MFRGSVSYKVRSMRSRYSNLRVQREKRVVERGAEVLKWEEAGSRKVYVLKSFVICTRYLDGDGNDSSSNDGDDDDVWILVDF